VYRSAAHEPCDPRLVERTNSVDVLCLSCGVESDQQDAIPVVTESYANGL
jgi:hypothetical protein